jgi:acyl carrier protein
MSLDRVRAAVLDALSRVAPEADPATIDPNEPLREQLELDSMDFLNFVIAVHEDLGVEIPEADYPRLATLEEAERYLEQQLAARGRAAT